MIHPIPKENRRSHAGFTLIELMIVISLIGILSSIGIYNFHQFARKARQAEAKINLGAMFNALQVFYGEQASYTLCLHHAGYGGPVGSKRYYRLGFTWSIAPTNLCGRQKVGSCRASSWHADGSANATCAFGPPNGYGEQVWASNAQFNLACDIAPLPATVPDGDHYLIGASGSIGNSTHCDRWSINQNKRLNNYESGL